MKKEQTFENMHLVPHGLIELDEYLTRPGGIFDEPHVAEFDLTSSDGGNWQFTAFTDFLAEYEPLLFTRYERRRPDFRVTIVSFPGSSEVHSTVRVMARDNQTIDDIFSIIEKYQPLSLFFPQDPSEEADVEIAAPAQSQMQAPQPVILNDAPPSGQMKNPDHLMRKTQTFKHMQLVRQGLKELDQYLTCQGAPFGDPHSSLFEIVYPDGTRREFDKSPAFLAEYYPTFFARYERRRPGYEISIVNSNDFHNLYSTVSVLAQDRKTIHDIFDIIEIYFPQSVFFPPNPEKSARNLFASLKHQPVLAPAEN